LVIFPYLLLSLGHGDSNSYSNLGEKEVSAIFLDKKGQMEVSAE